MRTELWKPIEGFANYAVSNRGHVKRIVPMPMPHGGFFPLRTLKPHRTWNGYLRIELHNEKSLCSMAVHRLVLSAFLRQRKDGEEANHKDFVKTNNHISNLEWITPRQNRSHALRHNRYHTKHSHPEWAKHQLCNTPRGDKHWTRLNPERLARGERNGNAVLTTDAVRDIRRAYVPYKIGTPRLAKQFGVGRSTIRHIVKNQCWQHLNDDIPHGVSQTCSPFESP